jgi:Xaa-Pro aminopeptidase
MRAAIAMIADTAIDARGILTKRGKTVTAEDVRRTIMRTLLDHSCLGKETIVACAEHSIDPHDVGSGPLRAHEPIVIDIFPQHTGHNYWGDLTRTVVKGSPSPALRRMYQAVRAAQSAALSRLRPGVRCRTVHNAAVRELERRGYETRRIDGKPAGFIHSTGHGLGLAIHEAPRLALSDVRLRRGHVVTVEPGLYYPGIGGIRIEDTVVVTAQGWKYLVPCEKRFEV